MKNIKPALEKIVRYSFTPLFLLEIIPATIGIYAGIKVAKWKGWIRPEDIIKASEIRYTDLLKQVYQTRKELYFPKEPLF